MSDVVVRRTARAVEDGYTSELVPGVHASADADRLADELAFAATRLARLEADPPAPLAAAALADDPEEGHWIVALAAIAGPEAAVDPPGWSSGEVPGDATTARTLAAYRAWAERSGGQAAAFAGDAGWVPERRFDRAFERLALPGMDRARRFELLVLLAGLGLQEVRAAQLHLGDPADPATVAAKRLFGTAERFVLERRATDLADAAGVPLEALDLALANWGLPADADRADRGVPVQADEALREQAARALGR